MRARIMHSSKTAHVAHLSNIEYYSVISTFINLNRCSDFNEWNMPFFICSVSDVRTGSPLRLDHTPNQECSRPTTCHATLVILTMTHSNLHTLFLFILLYLVSCDTTPLCLCFHIIVQLIHHWGLLLFSVYIVHVHSHIDEHTLSSWAEQWKLQVKQILYPVSCSKCNQKHQFLSL